MLVTVRLRPDGCEYGISVYEIGKSRERVK